MRLFQQKKKKLQSWQRYTALLEKRGYRIIEVDSASEEISDLDVVALYIKKPIGRGAFGNVYKAYMVDKQKCKLDKSKPLAVKHIFNPKKMKAKEASFFGYYYKTTGFFTSHGESYLAMALLPGQELFNDDPSDIIQLHDQVVDFNFAQRIELVANIMMAVNVLHHPSPTTGPALIHADLKGSNIKLQYIPETRQINVYIVDFGISEENNDEDALQKTPLEGTLPYMPNELANHDLHGIRSDIYSLTPIICAVLGATNPFKFRTHVSLTSLDYFKVRYDLTGIFEDYDCPHYPIDIYPFIIQFLNRMQAVEYYERPTSDECLRFFTSLNMFCRVFEEDDNDDLLYCYAAKLALLAAGFWGQKLNQLRELHRISSGNVQLHYQPVIFIPKTFEQYDFTTNIPLCKRIIEASLLDNFDLAVLASVLFPTNLHAAAARLKGQRLV